MKPRFKKGDKVEAFSKRETALGSWVCCTIISGNGHTYYIRYETTSATGAPMIERVPRKAIRPCSPTKVSESLGATNLSRGAGQKVRAVKGNRHGALTENYTRASNTNRDSDRERSKENGNEDQTYKLAMDAYNSAMQSLGRLGYMTWEQEALLTDLRLMLNISNEQHLMELRKMGDLGI